MICSGKTSTIYKAKENRTGKIVALKVINRFNVVVMESSAFIVERDILRSAIHPNIIELYSYQSNSLYDVLELECATDGSVDAGLLFDV